MMPRPWYRRPLVVGVAAIGLLLVATLFALNYRLSREPGEKSTEQGRARPTAADMAGMDMSSDGTVSLTLAQVKQLGVTLGTVEMRQISNEIRTVGTALVNETRVSKVTTRFSGYVEQLHVNFVGQAVRRGQPLAAIFSPDLLAAQQELILASRLSRTLGASSVPGVPGNTIDLLAAAKQRLRLWDVSEGQINAVLGSGRPMRTITLFAPASGTVLEKKVVNGQAIQAGDELYTIADLTDIWLDAQLREADAGVVAVGTPATLEFGSYPGRVFAGRVTFVHPVLADQSRTVRARIVVPNGSGLLKPGMYATVRLNTRAQSALAVPRSAVVQTGERSLVFVDMGGGQLMPHTVTLGRTGSDYIEVLSGVDAGQRVVTSPQFLIDSESNLGELMKGMAGMGPAASDPAASDAKGMSGKGADTRDMPGMSMPPKR